MSETRSTRARVGFNVRRGRARRAIELIQRAEDAGVETIWMTMGAVGADTPTMYAAAAVQTERITLGTSIVPAFTRHPLALASQALVLDDLASGRVRLGIGTSHGPTMAGSYGMAFDRPLTQLREYLQVLRTVLHTGEVEFRGDYYSAKGRLPGAPGTPVLISALSPRSFELAGELSDGAISWLGPLDYLAATARPGLERGAQRAGRDDVPPLVTHISVTMTDDRAASRAAAQKELGYYPQLPFYANMFAEAGYPISDGVYSDELLDQLVIFGDDDGIAEQLADLLEQGFDELLVMPVPVDDREGEEARLIDLIGRL